jgi:hypothetical protein
MGVKLRWGKGQTVFNPMFPHKYKGKYPIISRSSWELQFMRWADANPNILQWSSESIKIPYFDPVRQHKRRYYPDFWLKVKNKNGGTDKWIVEIKPYKESVPPKPGKKSNKTRIYESKTYKTNRAKWRAAEDFCNKMGYKFKILTERQLFTGRK